MKKTLIKAFFRFWQLKKGELGTCAWPGYGRLAPKYLHHAELFIGDGHDANMPLRRQDLFDTFDMHVGMFPAAAVPEVHAELEAGEAAIEHTFPEFGVLLFFLLGDHWKIIHDEYPHDSISIDTFLVVFHDNSGFSSG